MNVTLKQLATLLPGQILAGEEGLLLTGTVNTDSRKELPGSLFFALSGENFDGNDFAAHAAAKGAAAIIVSRPLQVEAPCGVILVKDTLLALQSLAAWWRTQLKDICVIGITGSNGKTSTKDFTKSVLEQRFRTIATQGNLNNHIGLPLSILSATQEEEAAVWEMGMNHPGELAPLCAMARPEIGIITGIGTAHLEFMKTRQAIAEEKSTLGTSLPESGTLIFPDNDDFADYLSAHTSARLLRVGGEHSPVRATDICPTEEGSAFTLIIDSLGEKETFIPVPGRHMISNALLAAAAGATLGLTLDEITKGLEKGVLTKGRLRRWTHSGCNILDDTYNANPDSMIAALDTLATTPIPRENRRIAVLGKMGELGGYSQTGHRAVGTHAARLGIDILVVVGEEAKEIAAACRESSTATEVLFTDDKQAAAALLDSRIRPGDALLFKGSRSAAMETLMNSLFLPASC